MPERPFAQSCLAQMPRERSDPVSIAGAGVVSLQARVRRAVAEPPPRGQAGDPGVPPVSLANANWLRQRTGTAVIAGGGRARCRRRLALPLPGSFRYLALLVPFALGGPVFPLRQ